MIDEISELNIRHMKLASGEELIGLINDLDAERLNILVERPVLMQSVFDADAGKERYYMSDYMPVSKHNIIQISSLHVIASCEVTDDIKETYINYCLGTLEQDDEPTEVVETKKSGPKTFH